MNPLIITPEVKEQIQILKKMAELNPLTFERLKELAENHEKLPDDFNIEYTIRIPANYQVTYTHEIHPQNVICRHLSVSVAERGKLPHPHAVESIMREFGFKNFFDKVFIWQEKFDDARRTAINVLEPLSGDFDDLLL